MSYLKAVDVFPKEILELIQQYVDGQCVYIPKKENSKKSWGEIYKSPERVFGGLLHHMYKIETDKGIFAVKQLNPSIMKRKTAISNYIFSEKVAKIAYLNQIPAIAAIEKDSCLYKIEDEYYMVFGWVEAKALRVEHVSVDHCKKLEKYCVTYIS